MATRVARTRNRDEEETEEDLDHEDFAKKRGVRKRRSKTGQNCAKVGALVKTGLAVDSEHRPHRPPGVDPRPLPVNQRDNLKCASCHVAGWRMLTLTNTNVPPGVVAECDEEVLDTGSDRDEDGEKNEGGKVGNDDRDKEMHGNELDSVMIRDSDKEKMTHSRAEDQHKLLTRWAEDMAGTKLHVALEGLTEGRQEQVAKMRTVVEQLQVPDGTSSKNAKTTQGDLDTDTESGVGVEENGDGDFEVGNDAEDTGKQEDELGSVRNRGYEQNVPPAGESDKTKGGLSRETDQHELARRAEGTKDTMTKLHTHMVAIAFEGLTEGLREQMAKRKEVFEQLHAYVQHCSMDDGTTPEQANEVEKHQFETQLTLYNCDPTMQLIEMVGLAVGMQEFDYLRRVSDDSTPHDLDV